MLDLFKNTFLYTNKYKTHSEAIVISCFFNPQNSPYRIKAFNQRKLKLTIILKMRIKLLKLLQTV